MHLGSGAGFDHLESQKSHSSPVGELVRAMGNRKARSNDNQGSTREKDNETVRIPSSPANALVIMPLISL
jgi:hypothetical protein